MYFEYDNKQYLIVVVKKGLQNTYIRIKDDKVYITTSLLVTKNSIRNLINANQNKINKMIISYVKRKEDMSKLVYLGNIYDIILLDNEHQVSFVGNKVYVKNIETLNKFMTYETKQILLDHYYQVHKKLDLNILMYTPRIRKMKSRWGVCNKKSQTITLNSNLIKYEADVIDYVIIHELCHQIVFNHSPDFWRLVENYCPNYKQMRKKLKE